MSTVIFLSTDQVDIMHDELLNRFGVSEGGGHRGSGHEGAEAAVQAVKNSYYESVHELAAAYAVYIVQVHVFMDGNKRTAAAAMLTFLEGNGFKSDLNLDDLADSMIELQERAKGGEGTDGLVSWLSNLLQR